MLSQWRAKYLIIVANAGSIVGTQAITSALGFVFWWLAARQFPPQAVGLASAAISALMLLGNVGVLGLGTLLIGELPRRPARAGSLISTALLLAGIVSGGLGILFVVAAPFLSAELTPLARSFQSVALFVLGVALTGASLVLDQAFIGLFRGGLQLWRNALFAAAKLGALWMAGIWISEKTGLTIYATWVVGILTSLALLAGILTINHIQIAHRPQLRLIRGVGHSALKHHALNLALQVPGFALPVMVTALLTARVNAAFYVAWMIAGFVFAAPHALTTVLYAVGAADPSALARKLQFTLKLSLLAGVLACGALMIGAHHVLNLFGSSYASQADWSLRILALGVFPMIVKVHYVAISRVHNRITEAAMLMAGGGALELLLAALGASIAGLPGLSAGWLAALCVEAVLTAPTVYRTAFSVNTAGWHQSSDAGPRSRAAAASTPSSRPGNR